MALKTTEIKRTFKYNGGILEDIPGLNEKEVIKVYAGKFPELVNGRVKYLGLNDKGVQEYEFVTVTGTKG